MSRGRPCADVALFNESQSRIVITFAPRHASEILDFLKSRSVPHTRLGEVTKAPPSPSKPPAKPSPGRWKNSAPHSEKPSLRNDPLSRSKMSGEFLAKRDEFVMETLLSLAIPFFFVLAGGYQEPMEKKLVPLHVRTFEIAAKLKQRVAVRSDH